MDTVRAITELPSHTNMAELRHTVGMINYVGKYLFCNPLPERDVSETEEEVKAYCTYKTKNR